MSFYFFLVICLFSNLTQANFADFFGPSAENIAIGGQYSGDFSSPANAHYSAASQAFNEKVGLSVSYSFVDTNFNTIDDVVKENTITKGNNLTGSIDTNYESTSMASIYINLPLVKKESAKLVFGMHLPVTKLIDGNTGDPFQTEYVMYRSRYKRTLFYTHIAFPFTDNFSVSLGAQASYQTSALLNVRQSLSGSSNGASAQLTTDVKPSLAGNISAFYKKNNKQFYFSFQQEMKTKFKSDIIGEATTPTTLPLDSTVETMLFYDPHKLRVGSSFQFKNYTLITSLEYQIWKNYQTPIILISNNGGVLQASDNYEKIATKDILIAKLGTLIHYSDRHQFSLALAFRPTPLDGNFSGSGNSVDTDATILASGYQLKVSLYETPLNFNFGLQYHMLKEKNITKTTNKEDGSSGNKVGSPGYKIGGEVYVLTTGINLSF